MAKRGRLAIVVLMAVVAGGGAAGVQRPTSAPEGTRPATFITYAEARPILERLAPDLAAAVAARPAAGREAAWLEWVSSRDVEIRARLERGHEDSIVNLVLYGTSFTKLARAIDDSTTVGAQRAADIVRGRIGDFIAGITAPGGNERLQFARALIDRRGIDPETAAGRERAREYILSLMQRASGEVSAYARAIASVRAAGGPEMAARSTLYRTRGLSSDTSLRPDFAIDRTLEALHAKELLDTGSVRRVAVIGPGLDFTDKAEGHDFYPLQTTQPFAVIDSLRRLRLARADDLRLTTIDLNPRVNGHLLAAQRRGVDGAGYTIMLPRERDGRWAPDLLRFWKAAGSRVGEDAGALPAPAGVEVRAVRIRPEAVAALQVRDLNIVVERLDPLPDGDRFDVVIATNILVYYDVFEQSLALANIAGMLRPGGVLLSNNVLVELPSTPIRSIGHTDAVYSDRTDDRDQVVWYQRGR